MDFLLRWIPQGEGDYVTETYSTADAALERLEQLALDHGVRDVTLWKRLEYKLRTQARLSTRLRATKTPPAVPAAGPTTPPGQAQDAGGSVPDDDVDRRDAPGSWPVPFKDRPIAVLGTPPPVPICEAIGCLERGAYPLRFKPKSPFLAEGDPILLAHFCGLHVEVKPESILWEFHRDFLERSGPLRHATARYD